MYTWSVPVQLCVHLLSATSKRSVHYLPIIANMCVHLLSTTVCTFARYPSAAAVDPIIVTLANTPANIFVVF